MRWSDSRRAPLGVLLLLALLALAVATNTDEELFARRRRVHRAALADEDAALLDSEEVARALSLEPNIHKLQRLPPQPLLPGVDYKGAAQFTPRECHGDRVCEASNKFQQKLFAQQYPKDCNAPDLKFLTCYPVRPFGFGSTFHHMVWCLNLGFATGRTVIFRSLPNIFNKAADCADERLRGTWECYFQPVSHCTEPATGRREDWKDGTSQSSDAKTIYVSMEWGLDSFKTWAPSFIREWLGDAQVEPPIWVKGQLAWFLNRLSPKLAAFVEQTKQQIGFKPPIAGIHVRRTDKVKGKSKEAEAVELSVYMEAVDKFFASHPNLVSSSVQRSTQLDIHAPQQSQQQQQQPKPPARNITKPKPPPVQPLPQNAPAKSDGGVSDLAARIHHDLQSDRSWLGNDAGNHKGSSVVVTSSLLEAEAATLPVLQVVQQTPAQSSASLSSSSSSGSKATASLSVHETVHSEKPRVFLATEDEKVMQEARDKWGSRYTFIVHPEAARADAEEKNRYNFEGMRRMLADVDMLAHCDYFVGTYSSNLGRWVYELLNYYHNNDAPVTSKSVDKPWHYEL